MATLTVTGRSDLAGVSADIDDAASSVRALGDDVAAVDDVARQSGAGLDTLADASDNAASRSSQAAGGLGDLAGGLEAIGATGAAGALEGVALAAQTAVGAGDILNLVSETTIGRFVLQTAASVAHRTATIAGAIATGTMTAAQTALNVVMSANPILLVVLAVAALTAAVVIAYRNSETFRDIIDGAFSTARRVVEAAAGAVESVVGWFRDLPGVVRDAAGDVKAKAEEMFAPIDTALGWVADLFPNIESGARNIASTVAGLFSDMFAPIDTALGWVNDLIGKLGSIDIPGVGRSVATTGGGSFVLPDDFVDKFSNQPVLVGINLTVTPQDKDAATRDLVESMREYFARRGQTLSITEAPA